jgi:hypothetical protein
MLILGLRILDVTADLYSHKICRSIWDSGRLRARLSFPYELEQIRIDHVFVSRAHAVRQARVNFQRGALHNLGRHKRSDSDRHNLIVVAMHD